MVARRALLCFDGTSISNSCSLGQYTDGISYHCVQMVGVSTSIDRQEIYELCSWGQCVPVFVKFQPPSIEIPEALSIIRKVFADKGLSCLKLEKRSKIKKSDELVAVARFTRPEDAERAVKEISGMKISRLGKSPLLIVPVYTVTFTLWSGLYATIRGQILSLMEALRDRNSSHIEILNTYPDGERPSYLRIEGEDAREVAGAKSEFDTIMMGSILVANGRQLWDPFFAGCEGRGWLSSLMPSLDLFIFADVERCVLRLYGDQEARQIAEAHLSKKCKELEISRTPHKMELDNHTFRRMLSCGLKEAQILLGPDKVKVDISREGKFLTILGSLQDVDTVLSHLSMAPDGRYVRAFLNDPTEAGDTECIICWAPTRVPSALLRFPLPAR